MDGHRFLPLSRYHEILFQPVTKEYIRGVRGMLKSDTSVTQELLGEGARSKLLGLPMVIVPADQTLAELAGKIKASKKMSLAGCFAAALAKQKKADVYTADPQFREVEKDIKIVWL